jgi:membrane-associated phospholipid phosphatase
MQPTPQTRSTLATALSLFGHPFVLLPVTVTLVSLKDVPPARALVIGASAAIAIVAPLLVMIRRKVKGGQWSDHDVSDPAQRHSFYPGALAILSLACVLLWLAGMPAMVVRGCVVSVALLVVGMLITRRSKISLHMIFGGYCATLIGGVSLLLGGVAFALIAAVAWSRVALGRHSLGQVVAGTALGVAGGLFLICAFARVG